MSYEGDTYSGLLTNQRIEGEPPDRRFVADGVVVDDDGEVVYARERLVVWKLGGPRVQEEEVQRYADRRLERLVTDVEGADGFDPTAIV
jgi:hypothetical protein